LNSVMTVRGLTRRFGNFLALDALSFDLHRGCITGLLGLNGAGKSTTLSLLTGNLVPDSGEISFAGDASPSGSATLRGRFGYLPEGAPLFEDLTVKAHLDTMAGLQGLKSEARRDSIKKMMARFELERVAHQIIDTLSKGYRRRVALAAACLGDPEILILDEPTDGLDPFQNERILDQLKAAREHQTLLISTHNLSDVERLCDRVLILKDGRLTFDGTLSDLKTTSDEGNLSHAFQLLHSERNAA